MSNLRRFIEIEPRERGHAGNRSGAIGAALTLVALFAVCSSAEAVPISLDTFYHDGPIAFSSDGSSATFTESPDVGFVFLSDAPGFGDPNVVIGGADTFLVFQFAFDEPTGNNDVFHAALLDGDTADYLDPAFELFVTSSGSGQYEFDLSGLSGRSLGVQFELAPNLGDSLFSSTLTVSNLHLETRTPPEPVPVPEPGTLALLLAGLVAALGIRRKRPLLE